MARLGISPTRNKTSNYVPAKVTVAVLSYIPHLSGYYRHRLDVLKLCLESILQNTENPFDLLVFDNGSCNEITEYLNELHDHGKIDYLILSPRNLGKIGAFSILFNAAPGELIAYSDDDVIYYPGWLSAHLEILNAYPNTGMVSGSPVRNKSDRSQSSLIKFIDQSPEGLKSFRDRKIPDEWEADWAISTGRDPDAHLEASKDLEDLVISLDNVEAYGSASHFQFLAPKQAILKALPAEWSGKLMGKMLELDEGIDQLGYLRLTTINRYTRHIGNLVSPEIAQEMESIGLSIYGTNINRRKGHHWLLNIPGMGRTLTLVYDKLFDILFNRNE